MFPDGEDLPIMTVTPIPVDEDAFKEQVIVPQLSFFFGKPKLEELKSKKQARREKALKAPQVYDDLPMFKE
jgi:hypothetical protein